MNKQEFLQIIRKQIHFIFDRDSVEQEISQHIEDSIADLMSDGYKRLEAEKIAVEQMGDPIEIGKQLNEEHHPLLGYLWVASNVVLAILIIPAMILFGSFAYNLYQLATPTTVENSEIIIDLDIEFDIRTHYVKLDYICVNEDNEYLITYRGYNNFLYSRAGWSSDLFFVKNEYGEYWETGGGYSQGPVGTFGYNKFEWPEDNILMLKTRANEIITIDLKEYDYEKK